MTSTVKLTAPQANALREIALHEPGYLWPPRGMVERLEAKGLIEVDWQRTATLGPFVTNATLTDTGRAALGQED